MSTSEVLYWVRNDLRILDNPALTQAVELAGGIAKVRAVYVAEETLGAAAKWWAQASLHALADSLAELGITFTVRRGDAAEIIPQLARDCQAVVAKRSYDPASPHVAGVEEFPGFLLAEPGTILNGSGEPYKVFTPFSKNLRDFLGDAPLPTLPAPAAGERVDNAAAHARIDTLGWAPAWSDKLAEHWAPGEAAALEQLGGLADILPRYLEDRDKPARSGTTRLSPRLRFGELSVARVWNACSEDVRRQLMWRDFAWHRLAANPEMSWRNVRGEFDRFPWALNPADAAHDPEAMEKLEAWQRGETGIALVDAGMRELWATGYMHNRVRMVVGSLLTKNLGIHWRRGERWFWDTLVDADVANNAFNWQWVAGCGDDAAPYFRIFNPETQAKRFDARGEYVARWAPLMQVPPIVDLKESRQRALAAYEQIKG